MWRRNVNSIELLKRHEGFRKHPYRCTAGKVSVGFGRNLDDVGISEEEATYLLERDVLWAVAHLQREPYWVELNEQRQAVLINMVFNLGWTGFSKFRRMLAYIRVADYSGAAEEMLNSAWAEQVKGRSSELARIMRTGRWPD